VARGVLSASELRGLGFRAYRMNAPCFWRLAPVSLIEPLAVVFGLLLLVVPGLLLIARWSVYIPAIVAERDSILGLGRSAELTRGHRWTGLWVSLVPGAVVFGPNILLRSEVITWAAVPFSVLLLSYGAVAAAVFYRRLVAEIRSRPVRVGRLAVADVPVARLATVRADGSPRLVPVRFALEGDTLYTPVDEEPKSTERRDRLLDVERDPRVEALVDDYDEDWSSIWWVRLRGRARVLERDERGAALLMAKYAQYRERPPQGPFIVVRIEKRVKWTAGLTEP
jgi:PPOX class probable F420-dependent enzyme